MEIKDGWTMVAGNSREPKLPVTRALALATGLVVAKAVLVGLRVVDGGGGTLVDVWAPLALLHQDALVVGAYLLLDLVVSRRIPRALWALVWVLVAYSAINVAVARVFSTPLTISMLGAAGGALSDSIGTYVTASNLLAIAVVIAASAAATRLRFAPRAPRHLLLASAALLFAGIAGSHAAARVETLGLHRNAAVALGVTGIARLSPSPRATQVGALADEGPALDLRQFAGAARGRNVVWVILESTAAEYLGAYGARLDPTPNLTRLSEDSLVFDAAYSAYPESIKGLWSMLCGESPAAQTTAKDYAAGRLPCASIATSLGAAGYRTAFFHSGRFRYLGMQAVVDDRGFGALFDAETIGGTHASSFGTDDASTVRRLLSFVDEAAGDRFFAVYSPISGHHPYKSPGDGPRPFPARTEKDHYLNDLFAGDAAFGNLVDGLVQRGVHQDTLYVIVGDHGEAFGQHEGNFAHTLHLYDENVRVPLIVSAPGLTVGRLRVPQIASLTDLAPTTLALIGLELPSRHEGRSLLAPQPGVARFYTDHGPLSLGLRQGRFKALHSTEHDRTRLFDLDRDPGEKRDLAAEHPERSERYRRHLLEWSASRRAAVANAN